MDFFRSQESLTVIEWALRAVVAFIFMVIAAKAIGQRAISQLRLLDFVVALVIGNIIAQPLSDERLDLIGSMVTTAVMVVLYLASIFSLLKFPALRRLLNPSPIIVVKDGEILYKALKKARISIDILLEELREQGAIDIKKVALAIWEADGKISVFLDPQYEPLTPFLMNMQAEPFNDPKVVIKEGKINNHELKSAGIDENWIYLTLETKYHTDIKNVLLATLDNKGTLNVFLYK